MNLRSADFTYDIPIEDLRRYAKLPPEEILRWLTEYHEFIHRALPPDSQRNAERFRQGKI